MGTAQSSAAARLPASLFDEFVAQRPEGETWELIDGFFVMQAQPTFTHQIIAGNIERLLNDALEATRPALVALQGPAVDMRQAGIAGGATYVPDVGVVEGMEVEAGLARSVTCYLAVEVVSPSDRKPVSDTNRHRIDVKVEGYRNLPSCEALLVVEQDRPLVVVLTRREGSWSRSAFDLAEDVIDLPSFGLRCTLLEVYSKTPVLKGASTGQAS